MSVSDELIGKYLLFCSSNCMKTFPSDIKFIIWIKIYECERDQIPDIVNGEIRYFNAAGKLHRDFDLPARIHTFRLDFPIPSSDQCHLVEKYFYCGRNCDIICTEYYLNGCLHRANDQPAAIVINSGDIVCEEYWVHGDRHRDSELPAVIIQSCFDHVLTMEWWWNGKRHRDHDLPAIIYNNYYLTPWPKHEEWFIHDIRCRNDPSSPHIVYYDHETGREWIKKWYNGQDGTMITEYEDI